jgi:hypothetical protein
MPVIGFIHLTSLEQTRTWPHFIEVLVTPVTRRAGTLRSNTGGDRVRTIDCQRSSPNWFAGRYRSWLHSRAQMPRSRPRRQTIPILFMQGADPVRIGLVSSLNRPDGNVTGINLFLAEVAGKRLQVLLETMPAAKSIAYLRNPTNPIYAESETREVQDAARALGVRLLWANASRLSEIDAAFANLVHQPVDAMFVSADGLFSHQQRSHRGAGSPLRRAGDLRVATSCGTRRPDELRDELS